MVNPTPVTSDGSDIWAQISNCDIALGLFEVMKIYSQTVILTSLILAAIMNNHRRVTVQKQCTLGRSNMWNETEIKLKQIKFVSSFISVLGQCSYTSETKCWNNSKVGRQICQSKVINMDDVELYEAVLINNFKNGLYKTF